jgi:FkbM family methyltransferase
MIIAYIKIIFWRIWDLIVKSVWEFLPISLRNTLWEFISSKEQIKDLIEESLGSSQGVIIQVGSNDGVSNDPLYESILRHKRKTFLVEPIDYLAEKLRSLHKENTFVMVCEYAIHPINSSVDFFHLPRDADKAMGALWKPWFDQIGSFSKDHLLKHSSIIERFIEKTAISCKTLNQLIFENSIKSISVLHIDAEGFDLEVLDSLDLDQVKPYLLMLEHKHLKLSPLLVLIRRMSRLGYKVYVYHDDMVFLFSK